MKTIVEINPQLDDHFDEYHGSYQTVASVEITSISTVCPTCSVYASLIINTIVERREWLFDLVCQCPQCKGSVFCQIATFFEQNPNHYSIQVNSLFPQLKSVSIPKELPERYCQDLREAMLVQELSPKASAALSRRILQDLLQTEYNIQHGNLAKEIDDFLAKPGIPSYLTEAVDAIRNIGNFAAHPLKNTNTGQVLPVESGEAEWLIEVLNSLIDFTFVQPAKLAERRNQLNTKLKQINKPKLKG